MIFNMNYELYFIFYVYRTDTDREESLQNTEDHAQSEKNPTWFPILRYSPSVLK